MTTPSTPGKVLVVDDDPAIRDALTTALDEERFAVTAVPDAAGAVAAIEGSPPEIVLLDLGLPDAGGLELIPRFREADELVGIIVLTATSDIATVVRAMRIGADNFLVKPVGLEMLDDTLSRALETRRRERRHRALAARSGRSSSARIIGSSPAMHKVLELIGQVADTDATVMLEGESGTGKGLAAEEIHRRSTRSSGPFLDMNCAALSPNLLESELFGHEQGAFTDAHRTKQGLFEIASGGSVFLDEIGEMPQEVQTKLLKALESRRFRRVGGVRDLVTDVRLIAATNRDLKSRVREGHFRQDLYYRLNVFAIELPPLRERPDDVLELAHHFLGDLNRTMGTDVTGFAPAAAERLGAYGWPGNVRELRNVVERAVILARSGRISTQHLPADLRRTSRHPDAVALKPLAEMEAEYIQSALAATGGNIKQTAEVLEVSRTTLYNKIKAHDLEVPD